MKAVDNSHAGRRRRGRPRYAGALTPRQQDVFELLVTGLTNEEIAQHLGIAPNSVKSHVAEILQRLGVENRHDAVTLHLRTERDGRLAALAPLMFFRKLPFGWLAKTAAGAALTAIALGIVLLAWGVISTSSVTVTTTDCSVKQTAGEAPNCAPGVAQAGFGAGGVTAISAGLFHSCALKGGGVWCWGTYYCCDGITALSAPMAMPGLASGVSAIRGGVDDCAVKDGGAWCWGVNRDGAGVTAPAVVPGLESGVSAFDGTCAVKDAGAWCSTQKDDGTYNAAAPMPGLTSGVSAFFGTCAVKDGGAWCSTQRDDGTHDVAAPMPGLTSGVSAIAISPVGDDHRCALKDGGVWCWGWNWAGQLGNNGTDSLAPVPVSGLEGGVSAISAGGSYSCALKAGGVWCWGDNSKGQLGNNNTTDGCGLSHFPCSRVPVAVSGLTSAVGAISTDQNRTCALKEGGVWCWGEGAGPVPVPVSGLASGVSAITLGYDHSCALKDDEVWCWGDNGYEQLGNNSSHGYSDVPVRVQFTPPGAGDIAERPAAKPLSSQPSTDSADHRTAYVRAGTAAAALAIVVAGVWAVRRRFAGR